MNQSASPQTAAKYPASAVICNVIGGLMIAVGAFVSCGSIFFQGSDAELAIGLGMLFGSILWFAVAHGLWILAQIEFNTRR